MEMEISTTQVFLFVDGFYRILGCNYGKVTLHERGEIVLGFQNV